MSHSFIKILSISTKWKLLEDEFFRDRFVNIVFESALNKTTLIADVVIYFGFNLQIISLRIFEIKVTIWFNKWLFKTISYQLFSITIHCLLSWVGRS